MGYHIYAWLEEGLPRLRIFDSATGQLSMDWGYQPKRGLDEMPTPQQEELKQLFRDLLLLTCQQDCRNVRLYGVGGMSLTAPVAISPDQKMQFEQAQKSGRIARFFANLA